jgi:hypothetical protein
VLIKVQIGRFGSPAVTVNEADRPQTDEAIGEQVRMWAEDLGVEEMDALLERLSADFQIIDILTGYLRPDQERPERYEAPVFDYPNPSHEEQWSFIELVFALHLRFLAEELHRPQHLGFRGAQYTVEHYKGIIRA